MITLFNIHGFSKDGEYLKTLITLGNSLEESKDKANLAVLVDLWKCIFLLNNSDLIQFLLVVRLLFVVQYTIFDCSVGCTF